MRSQTIERESSRPAQISRSIRDLEVGSTYVQRILLTSLPLVASDLIVVAVASYAVLQLQPAIRDLLPGATLCLLATFFAFRLYPGIGLNAVMEFRKTTIASLLFFACLFALSTASEQQISALTWCVAVTFVVVTVPIMRRLARLIASRWSWWGEPILILGDGEAAKRLLNVYRSRRLGLRPISLTADWLIKHGDAIDETHYHLSPPVHAKRTTQKIHWAAVTDPIVDYPQSVTNELIALFPHLLIVSGARRLPGAQHCACYDAGLAGNLVVNRLMLPHHRIAKRALDLSLAITLGCVCLPLVAALVMLIKLSTPGPVFYAQKRIGYGKKSFWAWKFRTMRIDADAVLKDYLASDPELREEWERDHKLRDDPRITKLGKYLRKTSLDELPQLWNILRGEMSFVGPRPIVADEIYKYRDCFSYYTLATPGITGLWQISGRNNTTYEERVAYDTEYVLSWSPWLDVSILARTAKVVLLCDGAY